MDLVPQLNLIKELSNATDPSKSHLSKRSFRGNSGSGALPTWFSF